MKLQRLLPLTGLALALLLATTPTLAANRLSLGTAGSFGVLAGSAVTNIGATQVQGDVGVSPGLAITGWPPGTLSGTIHAGDAVADLAQNDASIAYDKAGAQGCGTNLTGQDLGGQTLLPGVYCFDSSAQLTGQLTLDGRGESGPIHLPDWQHAHHRQQCPCVADQRSPAL